MNQDLEREHGDLLEFLYVCPIALAQLSSVGDVEMANPAWAQFMIQIDPQGGGANLFAVLERHAPELRSLIQGLASNAGVICRDHRVYFGRPSPLAPYPLVGGLTLVRLPQGRVMATLADLSQMVAQEQTAREAEERFRAVVDGVRDYAIFTLDPRGAVTAWNISAEKLFGIRREDGLKKTLLDLLPPEERAGDRARWLLKKAMEQGWVEDEGWWTREATTRFWGNAILSVIDSEAGGFTVILRDLSQRKRDEDELRTLANTDPLTGLYTRRYLADSAERELFRARRSHSPVSLLMIDADHFKRINDQYGHAAGDEVLKAVARMCRDQTREVDVVARFGGEEIVVLLPSTDLFGARNVAERLRAVVEGYHQDWEGETLRVTVSIGVATSNEGDNLEALLARADASVYEAKRRGRNRVVLELNAA
ncbi:MAG: GGDEF domain-containing protein [Deltaproteobacteria bacterium]|jgi:diguanylate cyclase (GGDEF)-like protein/PAS domain S-box-containing protein|nr:GGDEF domain-containing protein [Deltaproteobacteria bacterium]